MASKSTIDVEALLAERPWIHALARSIVGDDHLADDVTQQTFLAAIDRPPKRTVALAAWLARVARNFALRSRRDAATRRKHELRGGGSRLHVRPRDEVTGEDLVARTEMHHRIVGAVLALDEPYRATIIEHYFRGEAPIAIARRRGVPAATVRSQLKRGIDRLRRELRSESADPWSPALIALAAGAGVAVLSRPAMVVGRWGVTAATAAILYLAFTLAPDPQELPASGSEASLASHLDGEAGQVAATTTSDPAPIAESADEGEVGLASSATPGSLASSTERGDAEETSSRGNGIELRLEVELPRLSAARYWFIGETEVWTEDCEWTGPWLGAAESCVVGVDSSSVELATRGRLTSIGERPRVAALVQLIPLTKNGDPLPEVHYWAAETVLSEGVTRIDPVVLRRRKKPHRFEIVLPRGEKRSIVSLPVGAPGGWPSFAPTTKSREPLNVRSVSLTTSRGRGAVSGLPREWVVLDRVLASDARGDLRADAPGEALYLSTSRRGTRLWRGLDYPWRFVAKLDRRVRLTPYPTLPIPKVSNSDGDELRSGKIFVRSGKTVRARGWHGSQGWEWESTLVEREPKRKIEAQLFTPDGVGVATRRWLRLEADSWEFVWEAAATERYHGAVHVGDTSASLPIIVSGRTQGRWYGAWSVPVVNGQFSLQEVPPLELKGVQVEIDAEQLSLQLRERWGTRSPLEVRVYPTSRLHSTTEGDLGEWRFDVWVGHADLWWPLHAFLAAPSEWDAEVGTLERRFEARLGSERPGRTRD